jgi:ribosome-binding protein aMBF1 (putative translation factor)
MPSLGRRVRAARAHAGISRDTLAESLSFPAARLERLEAGVDEPTSEEMPTVIRELATATRLPEQFFTADFDRPV